MKSPLSSRLSWKLLGAILPCVVVAVSVIVWLHYAAARREILSAVDREINFLAQRAASDIDDLLRQRRRDLLTLSESPLFADYYRNVDFRLLEEAESCRVELERYLENFAKRTGAYWEILYFDERGREAVHVRRGGAATRGSSARSVHMVEARRLSPGGWWASEIQDHPGAGEAQYYVKAIHDESGAFKGALVLVYDVGQLGELLRKADIGRGARALIRTPERVYPPEPLDRSEKDAMTGRSALRERAWTVVVEVPLEESLGPLKTVRNVALVTALAGLLALVLAISLSVRSITGPVARLVEAARRVGEGDLGHRIPDAGSDEIGTLSSAFNEMARRLEDDRRKNKELQHQLIQAEKVAAAGLLLSSVAHELSNPLQVVAGHAQLLKFRELPAHVHAILEQIQQHALRCGRVVSNMLLFVRSSRNRRKPLKVEALLDSAIDLMRYRLTKGDDVRLIVESDPAVPEVVGDFQQLTQVLVNLISNARDAMEGVDTRERRRTLTVRARSSADWVILEVQDNGSGVPPELGDKVFEPFVTTKEPGRGTGLGLYISRQIIEGHHGSLSYESKPGEGTTFKLRLPVSQESTAEPATAAEKAEPERLPGKRILIVDDEPAVAGVIALALAGEGGELTVVHEGAEAVALLSRERFDLVISDIEMQGTKGYEVYERARAAPGGPVPLLVVTGNSLDRRVHKFFEQTGLPYVVKPFDTAFLRRAVRRLLAGLPVTGLQTD